MTHRWPGIVVVLTMLALGGCTGVGQAGRPVASASPRPGPTAAVEAEQLRRALLTADDLPPGWDEVGSLTEPNDRPPVVDCPRLVWLSSVMEHQVEVSFGHVPVPQNGPTLFEWLAWKGVPEADALIDQVVAVVRDCPDTLVDSGSTQTFVALAPLPFPALGDRTYALRMTFAGDRRAQFDHVFVRTGGLLVVVMYEVPDGEADNVVIEAVAGRALEKVRQTVSGR